jgi:hypothetical protein
VEGAEAPDEVDGVDADDLAGGEAGGDDVESVAVVAVVEGGDEDEIVGDVEVGVAGRETLAFEDDRFGHGKLHDLEGLVFEVAEGAEAVEVFGEGKVILVAGVGLDTGEDLVFGDEAGDVVDVAVGVVAGAAFVEPENLFNAQVGVEGLLEVLAGGGFVAEAGVALLDVAEEALFGGEQEAGSVGVDAAAFEDEAVGAAFGEEDLGFDLGDVVVLGDVVGDLVVAAVVVVLGPGVELPVSGGEEAGDGGVEGLGLDEDGAGVAEPDPVGGPGVEVDAGHVGAAALEDGGGAAFGVGVVDEDVEVFDVGEMAADFGVDPGDGLEFAGPVVGVVGPGDPGGGVGGPLGGHAVGLVGWRGHDVLVVPCVGS